MHDEARQTDCGTGDLWLLQKIESEETYAPRKARWLANESRLSCGALKKDSFLNLCAPPASSAC